MHTRCKRFVVAALAVLTVSAGAFAPVFAEGTTTTAVEQPPAASETGSAADPLTPPPRVEASLPAPAPVAAAEPAPVDSGLLDAVRSRLGTARASPGAEADHAALAAYYAAPDARLVWTGAGGALPRAAAALSELAAAADYGLDPARLGIPAIAGTARDSATNAGLEIDLGLAALTYARHARGGRVDPARISRMIDMRPRPFEPRSVLDALAVASDPAAYLRALHPQHAGFQRLQLALAKLPPAASDKAAADLRQRIVVNMERWRWMPDDLGVMHVLDNVPEQVTRVFKDGAVVLTEKIVVGKPNTPTPLFSADMQFVIFHPSWGVPEGIKSNELGPMLRRASANSSYLFGDGDGAASRTLRRHNLRVSHNGREVNPDSIDWTTANVRNFHFTQPPSGSNVLGVVKFRFPNRFDVYMHDTPERHLFASGQRAFSHGCMRVQNPLRLAEVLLAHDKGWSSDRVQGMVTRGGSAEVTLATPVPVHVTYFTVTVDEAGQPRTHGDLYGMDGRIATALAGRSVQLASAGPAAGAEADQSRRSNRRVPAAAKASPPWNPFAGLFAN